MRADLKTANRKECNRSLCFLHTTRSSTIQILRNTKHRLSPVSKNVSSMNGQIIALKSRQIMQLSVNSTDGSDSSTDVNYHPRRNHAFPIDNSSYGGRGVGSNSGRRDMNAFDTINPIPKRTIFFGSPGHKSTPSSSNSDIATLRISRLAGKGRCEFSPNQFFKRESPIPTTNPLYEGYSLSSLSSSASNSLTDSNVFVFSSCHLP